MNVSRRVQCFFMFNSLTHWKWNENNSNVSLDFSNIMAFQSKFLFILARDVENSSLIPLSWQCNRFLIEIVRIWFLLIWIILKVQSIVFIYWVCLCVCMRAEMGLIGLMVVFSNVLFSVLFFLIFLHYIIFIGLFASYSIYSSKLFICNF